MSNIESSKSAVRGIQTEGNEQDPLDGLRHNQTHTLPPGTRLGWISEPLADLPEEHLRATDETTRAALGVDGKDAEASRKSRRRLGLVFACLGLFVGMLWGGYLITHREAPRLDVGAKTQVASSEPSNLPGPSALTTASLAEPRPASNVLGVASSAAPMEQHPARKAGKQRQPTPAVGTAPPKAPSRSATDAEDSSKPNDFLFKPR